MNEQPTQRELLLKLEHLTEKVEEGFAGVHLRQDTTNGKVLKNSEFRQRAEVKLSLMTWIGGVLGTGIIGALITLYVK